MKLINVGNFLKRYEDNIPGDTIDAIELRMALWLDEPAVDAIPVEWLKQWEEKHKNDPCYCNIVSEEILADWEKENGRSK